MFVEATMHGEVSDVDADFHGDTFSFCSPTVRVSFIWPASPGYDQKIKNLDSDLKYWE